MTRLLQVALNGSRPRNEHPLIPRTAEELAGEARKTVEAGAEVVHLHVYGASGRETIDGRACSTVLTAVRDACPGVPISLSTSAVIEPDPRRRLESIQGWTQLPDLVSVNFGETGIEAVCHELSARGVGLEAGLMSLEDARAFVRSGLASACVRVLVEPLDESPEAAVRHAEAIEEELDKAGIRLEQVHHGDGVASWAVSERALARGHGMRTGLEDTTVLPDGSLAPDNAALVRAAVEMMNRLG